MIDELRFLIRIPLPKSFSPFEAQVGNYAFKIEGIEKIGEYTVEVYSQDEANIDMVSIRVS